jgi:hypothetical protein
MCLKNAGASINGIKDLGPSTAGTQALYAVLPKGTNVGIGKASNVTVAS